MEIWQALLSTALAGTEQQAPAFLATGGMLDSLFEGLDPADREQALLSAAGVMGLWQKAGYKPASDQRTLVPACEPDLLPRCNSKAGEYLARMLQGDYEGVLPEWLAAVASAGCRAPEEHLPALLDYRNTQPELRRQILSVLGRRGRWLAAQNSAWYYAAERDEATVWETGSRDERFFLIERLRTENPEQARQLLASTWGQEAAKERAAYLASFSAGLSMADEPFLESLLDDRSKEVRRVAVDLLARLPESGLVRRAIERAERLLRFKPARLLGRNQLEVTLPEAWDETMLRDGLEAKPPAHLEKTGEKAWQLQQLVSLVPANYWSRSWQRTPGEIIQASHKQQWQAVLIEGWSTAAQRHQDGEWAEALLAQASPTTVKGLLKTLPPKLREAYIMELLRSDQHALQDDSLALAALHYCRPIWGAGLTRAVLNKVRYVANSTPRDWRNYWHLQANLTDFALYIPPALLDEAAAIEWPRQESGWPQWSKAVEGFVAIVEFRRDVLREIGRLEDWRLIISKSPLS